MSNSTQTTVTPLTSTQQNLMMDEIEKIEQRLNQLYKDLQTTQQDFQDLVEIAKDMKNSQGTDAIFVRDVKEAQKCLQNIKDIEGWIDRGLSEADFQTEIIENLIYFPTVSMDDDFRAAVLRAPQPYRYNIVQMYLKGLTDCKENLMLLMRNKNNLQNAIKAKQPSELEKFTAELKARLEKIGAPAIKNVQEELQTMYKHSRDVNQIKRKNAEAQIPGLIETLKVHYRVCELSIQALTKKHSLQLTTVEGVEEHLKYELEEFQRIQSKGIMGRVPIVQAKVEDLKNLKELMIEKELTDKVLEGPEPEPFYQLPNWKEEIYPRQPFAKRVEMLDELLQKNFYADYSEMLTAETEIEGSTEYKFLIRQVTPRISTSQWENISSLLYQKFILGKLYVHSAMKIYYQNQLQPIVDPLDMRDAHEILKKIIVPDDCEAEYLMILDEFAKRPISATQNEVKTLSLTNQTFAMQIEQAIKIVLNPSNRTLRQILEGYDKSLGTRSSFITLKDGLLSLQETGRQRALCAFMELERENYEMEQLVGLKDILKKYIPNLDQKLEIELNRQMIEKIDDRFALLDQRVQSKNFNDLIEDLKLLEPSELTPTVQSALHYYQKCNTLILAFRETLAEQSQECMIDLGKNLARSSEDFSHNLDSFQKSLDQERNFSLVLPGLEQKLRALNIQKGQMVQSQSQTQQNSVIQAFSKELETYIGSLSGLAVDDEKWTQSLLKLCILSAQFPGEFDGIRKKLLDQYSDMIQFGLRKSYRLIVEDQNILRSFQEERGQGAAGPALAFQSLLRQISQLKINVENLLKNQLAASLKELDLNVNDIITAIVKSIQKDLMGVLEPQVPLLISGKRPSQLGADTASPEIETFQTALDLIGNFAESANESNVQEIFTQLKNLLEMIVLNSKKAFQECTDSFCQYFEPQVAQDLKILENTDICKVYEHILTLRQVSKIKDATAEVFFNLQRRVQEIVRNHTSTIKESMRKLEQGAHRKQTMIEQKEFLEKISQQVQEFKYFSDILEIDLQMKELMKKNIQHTFETCMSELYQKIHLKHVEDPNEWHKIKKVAVIVDDYIKIKDIFALIGIFTNKSQDQNVSTGFARAVCTAMDTIHASLSKPIQFMTPDHFLEFAQYFKYLEIIQKNKQMYIPDEQQQNQAQKMTEHINYLLQRQIDQLNKTFEYRFRRFLFSEKNERHNYSMLKRPSSIQFSIEEIKSQAQSQEELESESFDQRIKEACQEVKKLVEVPYWLIQMYIIEDTRNKEIIDPLSDLLKKIPFTEIAELYKNFKKSLFCTLFDGFNVINERLKYESEKESSLFYYKLKVLRELRQADMYFDMTSEEADSKEILGQAKQKYRTLFESMRLEKYEYSSINSAIQVFETAEKSNVKEEATMEYKQLFANKKFKKLSEELKLKEGVEFIRNQMTDHIKDEVFNNFNCLKKSIQDFKIQAGEVKEICHLILQLDAIVQFLPQFVDVQEIDEKIKKAVDAVQKVFDDEFKSINEQSEKFQYDDVIKRLYSIHMLIQKMQSFYTDSTQVDSLPNKRNSMEIFFSQIQTVINERKLLINTQLGKTLSDYQAIITNGKTQLEKIQQEQGYSAAIIINSIEQLDPKDTEWADTKIQVNSFVQFVKNKFKSALDQIKPETIQKLEDLQKVIQQINNLSDTLYFLPDNYFKVLQKPIEAKLNSALYQHDSIQKNTIDGAFETKDAEVIKKVIKDNSKVIDESFRLTLNDKFSKIIRPICQEGQRIICPAEVHPDKILEFMIVQVPKIQSFLNNDELVQYIHNGVYDDFRKQVKQNLKNLHHYNLCYVQRRIEMGSKPFQKLEKAVEKERDDNIKVLLNNPDDALDIIDHINQAKTKKEIIDGYDSRLNKFFKACGEHCNQLLIQLKEAIRTNSSATIVVLIDDIASNQKFVSYPKFIKAFEINYEQEDTINFEFVQAVRNSLRAEEPIKLIHQWGQDRQKQLKEIDFTTKTNKKSSKHERSNYYGRFIITFRELEEVATKVSAHDFFDYKGIKLRNYHESAQYEVGQKVQCLKDTFNTDVDQNIALGESRNVLSQKEAREIDSYFQKIFSGYQNLESILEFFTIIDPQMKEEIKESLNDFKDQIDKRINKIKVEATRCCTKDPDIGKFIDQEDLTKLAQILIEIQLMKSNFTKFKEDIQLFQDAIIDEYELIQEQKSNKGRLDNLIRLIQGQDWGAQIINDCSAFQGHKMKELAKKLNTKNVQEVLKQITGQDISVKDNKLKLKDNFTEDDKKIPMGKTLLEMKYDEFYKAYQKKLIALTTVRTNDKGEILPIDLKIIVQEIKSIEMDKQKWNDKNIENLPKLLSLIFTLWSLQKPELLEKQQKSRMKSDKEDKEELKESESKSVDFLSYLNQPHPAQILGIMRILGVGYAPNEYVDTEKKRGLFSGLKQLFGLSKTKIRNNLVQIKTGEGKSVTLAVLSIIFALCDFDVRCACYSAYLSERDFKAFEKMFDLLGLTKQIIYNTFNQICETEINKSGELRQIMLNLLLKNQEKVQINSDSQARPQILLIDEVDVFFSESFFGNTYMPQAQIKGPQVQALTDYIWENRDQGLNFKKVSVTEQYQKVLGLFQGKFAFLLKESVKQMLVDLLDIPKFKLGVEVEGMFIMDIIDGCIKYKVGDSWSAKVRDSYRTMFAYYYYFNNSQPGKDIIQFETFQDYKAIGINFTQLSFAEIPLSFTLLLGVTGTLDTLSEEQQKIMKSVYNFISKTFAPSVYDIPKHLKKKEDKIDGLKEEILIMNEVQEREYSHLVTNTEFEVVNEMEVKIINSKEQWFEELSKRIAQLIITKNTLEDNIENQRAVIVFFKSEEILNEFLESEHFDTLKTFKYGVLTDKLDNIERDSLVTNATIQGQITLSTREFGRGTDFKYHGNAVINAGGLAVIQTFFTFDYSEEIQIRGRTRRQGTTGSYEILVSQEDLNQLIGNENAFVESLNSLDPRQIYKILHLKRLQAYELKQRAKSKLRDDLKIKHEDFINHLENIKRYVKGEFVKDQEFDQVVTMLQQLNTCQNYDIIFRQKERCIKTLVLIDATGSMGSLLKNVQDTILQYFEQVCKSLKDTKYNQNLFKIQIAFYRNYNDGANILKVSPWVGPNEKQTLKDFVDKESASGGTNISANEAMEIAFLHANKEIYSPPDGGEPVSLIFVIGDQPSNNKQEILRLKYKSPTSVNPSMKDEEARSKYGYKETWNESLQAQYGESVTWDTQLDKIKKFEDEDGFKIPVQSFYVQSANKAVHDLQEFYSKLRVNNSHEEKSRLLNLSHKESLVLSLCAYTMNMIGDKNPDGGNKVQLQSLAGEMLKKQLAFAQ